MHGKDNHTTYTPFLNVFTTQKQTIPKECTVRFDDLGEINGFNQINLSTFQVLEEGIYQFYYYLLPLLGPTLTNASSAFGIKIHNDIAEQTRAGTGFSRLPLPTAGPFVLWGLIRIPDKGRIQLVNIDTKDAVLDNTLLPVSTATASLTLRKIAN